MTRRQWITLELQRLGKVAQAIQQRYQAYFGLHNAACMTDNRDEIAQRRDELHTVLDALLDNGEQIQRLVNEMERTPE